MTTVVYEEGCVQTDLPALVVEASKGVHGP